MKKRVICLLLTLGLIMALAVIEANAASATGAVYLDETFTKPADGGANWAPEGWSILVDGESADKAGAGTAKITDEGYIEMHQGNSDGIPSVKYTLPALPSEVTLMYDVYGVSLGGWIVCSLNGYNQTGCPGGHFEYLGEDGVTQKYLSAETQTGVWYTYCFQLSGERMSVYRKVRDGGSFEKLLDNVKMKSRGGNQFYTYSVDKDPKFRIDNVKVFAGTLIEDEKIDVLTNGEKKQLKGSIEISLASQAADTPKPVVLLMGIYDSKGKIVDMEIKNETLSFGDNTIEILSKEYTAEDYNKLRGCTAEVYVWDTFRSLQPQTNGYSITLD